MVSYPCTSMAWRCAASVSADEAAHERPVAMSRRACSMTGSFVSAVPTRQGATFDEVDDGGGGRSPGAVGSAAGTDGRRTTGHGEVHTGAAGVCASADAATHVTVRAIAHEAGAMDRMVTQP